jgi:hypothetical protein
LTVDDFISERYDPYALEADRLDAPRHTSAVVPS